MNGLRIKTTVEDEGADLGLAQHPNLPSPLFPSSRRARPVPPSLSSHKRTSSNSLTSPSSPDLSRIDSFEHGTLAAPTSSGLGRFRTLPRTRMRPTISLDADVDPTPLEPAKLVLMQRWVLSLAIVNFDLDVGYVLRLKCQKAWPLT